MQKCYNFHPVTREFIGESNLTKSPLEPGTYLIPSNATTIQPPASLENKIQTFNLASQTWGYIDDFRGQVIYLKTDSSQEAIMGQLGPISDEYVLTTPDNDFQEWSFNSWGNNPDKVLARNRGIRDSKINEVLWILDRHRNQKDFGIATTITDEKAIEIAEYVQILRDLPNALSFGTDLNFEWPQMPTLE